MNNINKKLIVIHEKTYIVKKLIHYNLQFIYIFSRKIQYNEFFFVFL